MAAASSKVGAKGFWTMVGDAAADGELGERPVGLVAGDDVDEVEALGGEHRARVGVGGDAEGTGGALGRGGVAVADGREGSAFRGERRPGVEMVRGVEAAADDPDPRRHVVSPAAATWEGAAGGASRCERLHLGGGASYGLAERRAGRAA